MLWTKAFIPTLREASAEAESASHQLMLRAGLIRMLSSGVYSYLPLGLKALNNIENIIRQEIDAIGAQELLLPALQPLELWQKSGRDKQMGEVMIRFTDRRGRRLCLGPTHEEVITDLARTHISSYRQLPLVLYQIQVKFRDEIRPRFGVVRACEFIMKDAYSFDKDEEGLEANYNLMHNAYNRIFKRCGLKILSIEADCGVMGGEVSHEFMVPSESGEDMVWRCPNCDFARGTDAQTQTPQILCGNCKSKLVKHSAIEVGHIFKLGTKYTDALGAKFLDGEGRLRPMIMGCYGIGVSRMVAAIIEQNHDQQGVIWPWEVAPFRVSVIPVEAADKKIINEALKIYSVLQKADIPSLLDDRDERAGVKFKDADLIGIPLQIIISKKTLKNKKIEIKRRRDSEVSYLSPKDLLGKIRQINKDLERGA